MKVEGIERDDLWRVIDSYFDGRSLAHEHIDSFDHFMDFDLMDIVTNHPPLVIAPTDGLSSLVTEIPVYVFYFSQVRIARIENPGSRLLCRAQFRDRLDAPRWRRGKRHRPNRGLQTIGRQSVQPENSCFLLRVHLGTLFGYSTRK